MNASLTAAGATERRGSAEFLCVGSAFCGACGGEAWFEVCKPTSLNLNNFSLGLSKRTTGIP